MCHRSPRHSDRFPVRHGARRLRSGSRGEQPVVAEPAADHVVASPTEQAVVPRPAVQPVILSATEDAIVTEQADDEVPVLGPTRTSSPSVPTIRLNLSARAGAAAAPTVIVAKTATSSTLLNLIPSPFLSGWPVRPPTTQTPGDVGSGTPPDLPQRLMGRADPLIWVRLTDCQHLRAQSSDIGRPLSQTKVALFFRQSLLHPQTGPGRRSRKRSSRPRLETNRFR